MPSAYRKSVKTAELPAVGLGITTYSDFGHLRPPHGKQEDIHVCNIESPAVGRRFVAGFVDDLRRRTADFSEYFFCTHRRIALHFLIWIDLTGVELKEVDATIVYRFLRHDCRCGASCASVRFRRWRKRRRSTQLMKFVRFLEQSGHIETPGELEDNLRLLDAFLGGLRDGGYAAATINRYRFACTALIVWLHLSRICLSDLTLMSLRGSRNGSSLPGSQGCFVVGRRGDPTHTQPNCAAS